jgi:hypothetical protein
MTPEETGKAIIQKFMPHAKNVVCSPVGWVQVPGEREKHAKSCAILCCKEIIEQLEEIHKPENVTFIIPEEIDKATGQMNGYDKLEYWQDVLEAIELL